MMSEIISKDAYREDVPLFLSFMDISRRVTSWMIFFSGFYVRNFS